jgi:hypothetical protein
LAENALILKAPRHVFLRKLPLVEKKQLNNDQFLRPQSLVRHHEKDINSVVFITFGGE